MKNIKFLHILLVLFCAGIFVISCKKDSTSTKTNTASEVDKFIWYNLSYYYLWADSVPKLTSSYFSNDTNKLNTFLATYTDPSKLFSDLLYKYGSVDRFSWIEEDSSTLQNELKGVTKSMGFDYGLALLSDNSSIMGVVHYVLKGSPAESAGLKRGDLFTKVNGQQLTKSNYSSLLSNTTYNLTLAYITNNTLYTSTTTATMTAVEVSENPILFDSIYTISGNKIAYLVYNGFYSDYDNQLNTVFASFKSQGVNNLILDLRYNGGGAITTANKLASMIYGTYTDKTFINTQYNSYLQNYYTTQYGSNALKYNFTNTTGTSTINTLNLSKLYVLTSGGTASASELIINGLRPYIPVYIIGDTTYGKNVGSITITDTKKSAWAMQPIVVRMTNSLGKSDYTKGFAPNDVVLEDITNLIALGNTSEPLLQKAIGNISGTIATKAMTITKSVQMRIHQFTDRKDMIPHMKEMYLPSKSFMNKQ